MSIKTIETDMIILSRVCDPVYDDENAAIIAKDLRDTMNAHDDAIGLAAPQIGYNARMFAMKHRDGVIIIRNPKIHGKGTVERKFMRESCLSRPGVVKKVGRFKVVRVKYWDEQSNIVETRFYNMDARIFQHEYDHLNGVLI